MLEHYLLIAGTYMDNILIQTLKYQLIHENLEVSIFFKQIN